MRATSPFNPNPCGQTVSCFSQIVFKLWSMNDPRNPLQVTTTKPAKTVKKRHPKNRNLSGGLPFSLQNACVGDHLLDESHKLLGLGWGGNILRMLTLSRGNSLLRHFCHSYLPCSGIWWDSCWQTWAVERLVGQIYSPGAGETVCCRLFHTRTQWVYVWPYTIAPSHDLLEGLKTFARQTRLPKRFFLGLQIPRNVVTTKM